MILGMERMMVGFSHHQCPTHSVCYSQPTFITFARASRSVDFEYFLNKYKHISRPDLENLRDTIYDFEMLEGEVDELNDKKILWSTKCREHVEAGSLVEILSAQISPHKVDITKPLAVFGRIYIEFYHIRYRHTIVHDLFNRRCDDPEIIDLSDPYLPLNFPLEYSHMPPDAIPVPETKIVVDLWDANEKTEFAQDVLLLEDISLDEYERFNSKFIGSIELRYFSMLFGIHCYADVLFYQRMEDNTRPVLNVYGEIVARYDNSTVDGGCTLFKKLSHEFGQVEISTPGAYL